MARPGYRFSLLLLLLSLVLGACSFRFLYNHVDIALIWRIDDFLDLDRDQRQFVRARLTEHLNWHRGEMVLWRDFVLAMHDRVGDGVSEQDLQWFYSELTRLRDRLGRQLAADTSRLLSTATPAQLDDMLQALEKENQEMAERAKMTDQGRARERGRMTVENLEQWTGYLTEPQRARVRELAAGLPDVTVAWLRHRRERQQAFVAIARRAAAGEEVTEALYQWFTAARPDEFQPFFHAVNKVTLEVDGLLNASQRERLQNELMSWVEDMSSVLKE